MKIFIPGNVPSSKNSKVKTARGVFNSKTVTKYLRGLGVKSYSMRFKSWDGYKIRPNVFEAIVAPLREYLKTQTPPHPIGFHFVRDSRRRFDFTNAVQILADLMVCHQVIQDDDMDNFLPYYRVINGQAYSIDKHKPGVWIFAE